MHIGRNTIKKFKQRGGTIVLNSLYFLLVPFLNFGLYLVVLQLNTAEAWGHLVELLLIVNLVMNVLSWGSTSYLLRSFSNDPATIPHQWQEAFFSRAVFLVLPGMLFLIFYPWTIAVWLVAWLCLLFLYRSLEVFIIYLKRFKVAIVAEIAGFLLLAGGIVADHRFTEPAGFAKLFAASMLLKAVAVLFVFRKEAFDKLRFIIDFQFFRLAFPFMIIAIVGLLQEKIDLYLMAVLGTTEELGKYHVLISALNILKTGAAFLLQPYIKNIYRLPLASIRKLSFRMALAGIIIVSFGTVALMFLVPTFFGFDFEWKIYLIGALVAFPYYYYITFIYRLYRRNREKKIIMFISSIIGVNAILSIIFIPVFGMKGALFASAIAEWVLLFILIINEWYHSSKHR